MLTRPVGARFPVGGWHGRVGSCHHRADFRHAGGVHACIGRNPARGDRPDPCRYRENVKDPEVQAWLRAQGDVSAAPGLRTDLPLPSLPAVGIFAGARDERAAGDVWHSTAAASRLQAASRGGKPVLLRLDAQSGPGVGSKATQRNAVSADIFSFLLWQMGKAPLNDGYLSWISCTG